MDKKVDKEIFSKALNHILLEAEPVRQPITDSTIIFFREYNIPKDLQDLLIENSFDRPLTFGHIFFNQANEIQKENLHELNINCISEGLLITGFGLNGDLVVFDLQTWTMGFVLHDELWDDTSEKVKARRVHVDTGLNIGLFYHKAATEVDTFPVDGDEAEEIYSPK